MKFYNTNEDFGGAGPFEYASEEALADDLMDIFRIWAGEASEPGADIESRVSAMREEFIEGLVEVAE